MAIDASIDHRMPIGRETIRLETVLDDRINKLKKAGTEPKSVMRGEHVGVVIISDPDGNQWCLCRATVRGIGPLPESFREACLQLTR